MKRPARLELRGCTDAAKRILVAVHAETPSLGIVMRRYILDRLLCEWLPDGGDLANMSVRRKG